MTLAIRQVAYFVADVCAAATAHHHAFGSGPYFVAEHIPLRVARHRGVDRPLDHTSAYGQWGEVMIEVVQQNNLGPSPFRDMYPDGARGAMHHIAVFADDLPKTIAQFNADGHATALYAEMNDGFAFAFIDTVAAFGHMIEIYAPVPALINFYATVAGAAASFTGGDIISSVHFA